MAEDLVGGELVYRPVHPLLGEAVYARLSGHARQRRHAAVAEALGRSTPVDVSRLAHHAAGGQRPSDGRSCTWSRRAATGACTSLAARQSPASRRTRPLPRPVRIVRDQADFAKLRAGDVLICPVTSPVWSVLFATAGALVTGPGLGGGLRRGSDPRAGVVGA